MIAGQPIETWAALPAPTATAPNAGDSAPAARRRRRLDRQTLAIGPASDAKLASAKVAVVGLSGGGSHVFGQLAHMGIGTLIAVDDDVVTDTNLGRLIGATESDVDRTAKVDLAHRVATGVDASINVRRVPERFPSAASIAALKEADVIVTCLDRLDARAAVNELARRYLIPLVDIGIQIRSRGEHLAYAHGQLIVSLPGGPCMRCWFLTDEALERERLERPPGYDEDPNAPGEPQVVSMNGTLASEACNCVLDLITGYSRGHRNSGVWRYDGRSGRLEPGELPSRRPACPACAQEAHGDPHPGMPNR